MNLKYPKRSRLGWVSEIRNSNFGVVLAKLLAYYLALNIFFAIIYYIYEILRYGTDFFDYIYFSFVTSLAIGYGDFVPIKIIGKILIIIHSCITTMYFAIMVSILSVKMFYPKDSIRFSEKIVYNPNSGMMIFRVINTNKEALINPEVRISITEHNVGDIIAGVFNIITDYDITYLGRHDFSYSFKSKFNDLNLIDEANKAKLYNSTPQIIKSRFRINISISGSYGLHQIAIHKKYNADNIIIGKSFKAITYNEEGYRKKGGLRYYKIKKFWEDFESIEKY